jgi:hypothetical protein
MSGGVTCNDHHVFSAIIRKEWRGAYLSSDYTLINYNLRRGTELSIGDLLNLEEVGPLVDELRDGFGRQTREAVEAASKDGYDLSYLTDRVFQEADLEHFSVKAGMGLYFYFDIGLPHALEIYKPDNSYGIDFEALGRYIRRDGPLWPLARDYMGF